jgi:hypothetical protein
MCLALLIRVCPGTEGGVTNLGLALAVTQTFSILHICDSPIRLFLQLKYETSFLFPYCLVIFKSALTQEARISSKQCCGSVPYWYGSRSAPLTNGFRKMAKKICLFFPEVFCFLLIEDTSTSFFCVKNSQQYTISQ